MRHRLLQVCAAYKTHWRTRLSPGDVGTATGGLVSRNGMQGAAGSEVCRRRMSSDVQGC